MTHLYRSRDGLLSSSDPAAVAAWNESLDRQESAGNHWRRVLRAMGVKYAHPDDGWVKRDAPEPYATVSWYPLFDDHPEVGDLMAFGSAYDVPDHYRAWSDVYETYRDHPEVACDGFRIVRCTRVESEGGGMLVPYARYYYEDTGIRVPDRAPAPSVLRRIRDLFPKGRR